MGQFCALGLCDARDEECLAFLPQSVAAVNRVFARPLSESAAKRKEGGRLWKMGAKAEKQA